MDKVKKTRRKKKGALTKPGEMFLRKQREKGDRGDQTGPGMSSPGE